MAQHPPAYSTSIRFTFCLRRVTASPTHRLQRHRRSPFPEEYAANSVMPWCLHTRSSTGQRRVGEGGRPARLTSGTGGGGRFGCTNACSHATRTRRMPPVGLQPTSRGLKGRRVKQLRYGGSPSLARHLLRAAPSLIRGSLARRPT